MRELLDSSIGRMALILGMPQRDQRAVLNEAIRCLVADDEIQDVRKIGRVLGTTHKDMNERDIARIDQTREFKKGHVYVSHGRRIISKKDWSKTTRGFRVQFKHEGRWYRKFFSDSKCGGPFGARAAARKWRDSTERAIGRNVVTQKVTFQTWSAGTR